MMQCLEVCELSCVSAVNLPTAVVGVPRVPIPASQTPAVAIDTRNVQRPPAPVPGATLRVGGEFRVPPEAPIIDSNGFPVAAGSQV